MPASPGMRLFLILIAITADLSLAGDWGKVPVGKEPVEECVDLGGRLEAGYHTAFIFRGFVFAPDNVTVDFDYTIDCLPLPVVFGVDYMNVASGNRLTNTLNDQLALSLATDLPEFLGIRSRMSFTHYFYPEDRNAILWPSGHGEVGLHLSRDLSLAVLNFDLLYNTQLPNAWNGTIPTVPNPDTGAWYWDLGLERAIPVFGQNLVLEGGVAFADNYWGTAPGPNTGGESSGWNHYYLRASLPIELNCRTVLTPYIGYIGAPEGWLMDGAPNWLGLSGQSDHLYGGVTLSVSF